MSRPLAASKKTWAAFCALAMCAAVGMTTDHIAVADSATQDSNIVASLKYMSELNKLRQTKRTTLTAQQIIKAQNADNGANMQSGQVAEDTADGSPVNELNVNTVNVLQATSKRERSALKIERHRVRAQPIGWR